jgi:Tol biopolymer transport system component
MKRQREHPSSTAIARAAASLAAVAVLALAACGGSSTTTSPSPLVEPSPVAASSAPPSATPLPTPTVAGTIAFLKLTEFADDANGDIYIVNTDGTGLKRLTNDPDLEDHPVWSPDGRQIAYVHWPSNRTAAGNTIWVMNADGTGKKQLTRGDVHGNAPEWSPDGKQIAFWRQTSNGESIYVINADGSGVKAVAGGIRVWEESPQGPEYGGGMAWAPDGRILYLSAGEVVAVFPDGSKHEQLTQGADLGTFAMSPDGAMFALENSARRLQVTPVQAGGASVPLLDPVYDFMADPWTVPSWAPDGKSLAISSSSLFGMTGSPIYIIGADGSGLSQVPGIETANDVAWRPE